MPTLASENVDPSLGHDSLAHPGGYVRRVGVRFLVLYFVLYSFPSPLDALPYSGGLWRPWNWMWDAVDLWVGENLLGFTRSALMENINTGDRPVAFVEYGLTLAFASLGALGWGLPERGAAHERRLLSGLRVYVRYALAYSMLLYGIAKVFPIQFGTLGPHALMSTYGESSPVKLLWTMMAASPVYAFVGGALETVGGALLLFRRTTLLGALLILVTLANVVLLNFCYDVGVKLHSSHLLLMTLFLIAPDGRRLLDACLPSRDEGPVLGSSTSPRLRWAATIFKFALILGMCLVLVQDVRGAFAHGRIGTHRRPLQGVWEVETFERSGAQIPPCTTEPNRWQYLLVENRACTTLAMDRTRHRYKCEYREEEGVLILKDPKSDARLAAFQAAASPARLELDGMVAGRPLRVTFQRKWDFRLTTREFHWIDNTPFDL